MMNRRTGTTDSPRIARDRSGGTRNAARDRILTALREGLDTLVERAVDAIQAEVPAYGGASPMVSPADLRDQVRAHYLAKITVLGRRREAGPADIAFVSQAAARRASEGLPLSEYVTAYQVGRQVFWGAVTACAARIPAGREAALELADPTMAYTDFASRHASRAYLTSPSQAARDDQGRELLDRLLAGDPLPPGPLPAAAHRHGLVPQARLLVLVAVPVADSETGAAGMPGDLEGSVADMVRAGASEAEPLVGVRGEEAVAIRVLPRGTPPRTVCDRIDSVRRRLWREGVRLTVGVSTVVDEPAGVPRAHREARTAAGHAAARGGITALCTLSPFQYLSLRADEITRNLVDPRVRALLAEDRSCGGALADTVRAFAEANLSPRVAAASLHVHHNTVHYRLRRIQERTGRDPRRVADLLDLLVALAVRDEDTTAERGAELAGAVRGPSGPPQRTDR